MATKPLPKWKCQDNGYGGCGLLQTFSKQCKRCFKLNPNATEMLEIKLIKPKILVPFPNNVSSLTNAVAINHNEFIIGSESKPRSKLHKYNIDTYTWSTYDNNNSSLKHIKQFSISLNPCYSSYSLNHLFIGYIRFNFPQIFNKMPDEICTICISYYSSTDVSLCVLDDKYKITKLEIKNNKLYDGEKYKIYDEGAYEFCTDETSHTCIVTINECWHLVDNNDHHRYDMGNKKLKLIKEFKFTKIFCPYEMAYVSTKKCLLLVAQCMAKRNRKCVYPANEMFTYCFEKKKWKNMYITFPYLLYNISVVLTRDEHYMIMIGSCVSKNSHAKCENSHAKCLIFDVIAMKFEEREIELDIANRDYAHMVIMPNNDIHILYIKDHYQLKVAHLFQ